MGMILALLFFALASTAGAVLISGSGRWGDFRGSLAYTCTSSPGEVTLTVELRNTSSPGNGGYITGFALNNPGGRITTVAFADSVFHLLGEPVFHNGINALPLGHFDIGAAMEDSWEGGGDPASGIAVGETRSFRFTFQGDQLCAWNIMNLVNEPAAGGDAFFAVRFRGFQNGESDKVATDEVTVPVTLSSFTAVGLSGSIEVRWTSQTEVNALSYHLYRSQRQDGDYTEIARLDAQGDSEVASDYRHVDGDVTPNQSYFYKLADKDVQGNVTFHGPVLASATTTLPGEYRMLPNYPNPFNASTAIAYQLPASGYASLIVYDVLGRKVRTLVEGYREAGSHTALWNGQDDRGKELKSGVYFCVFEAGHFSDTMKMVLTR
jgi:hypothetical protein